MIAVLLLLLVLFGVDLVPVSAQQDSCPLVVEMALETADRACEATGRNQICYGHDALQAQARHPHTRLRFTEAGDVVDVAALQALTLSAWDAESRVWGVALMRLQANLPQTMPGQHVLFVLFGAVEIHSAVAENDRRSTPMQAFTLQTGVGDAPCAGAPQSGVLVQTPHGVADVDFTVNGVQITLGSTAFLQARAGDQMTVRVLEGQALVTADGETATVPQGAEVSIALDDDLLARGAPGVVLPYDADNLRDLPLMLLDRAIVIAAPLATVCTVTMPRTVNIRTGPGTDYPIETRSTPGALFHYVGQTRGTDGYIWYLTACGFWVREDLIPADCSFVPDVSPSK